MGQLIILPARPLSPAMREAWADEISRRWFIKPAFRASLKAWLLEPLTLESVS